MVTPYGGFNLPPEHVGLMKNSDGFDPDGVVGKVSVDLCKKHTEISKRMVFDHETTPVPECDTQHVSFESRELFEALAGGEDLGGVNDGLRTEMVIEKAAALQEPQPEYITETELYKCRVVVLTEKEMPDSIITETDDGPVVLDRRTGSSTRS